MPSDAQLVSLSLESGDADAFSVLVKRYTGMVMGAVLSIVRDRHEAEDLAQEVFVRAFRNLEQLRERNRFSSWLMTIAANVARRHFSGKRPVSLEDQRRKDDESAAPVEVEDRKQRPAHENMTRAEVLQEVVDAVENLPEAYRGTVHLRCLKGHSCKQIAEIEGVSVGVITSRLSRAYEMLRGKLGNVVLG